MMRRIIASAAVVALGLVTGSGSLTASPTPRNISAERVPVHPIAFFDQRTFAMALSRAQYAPAKRADGIRAVVVPHHWLAADLIVEGLRGIERAGEIRRVVLIGPNHIGAGGASFTTSGFAWRVPGGVMRPDAAGLAAILAHRDAKALPNVMSNEHSVAGLVPAVRHFFPNATVVPLAVRARTDAVALRRMARTLSALLQDPATVLVVSVDFSHYKDASEALRRNRESIEAISGFDIGRVLSFGNEHMDSPATIALLLETMRRVGANRFELWDDKNSTDFGGPSSAPNVTSYVVGAFL